MNWTWLNYDSAPLWSYNQILCFLLSFTLCNSLGHHCHQPAIELGAPAKHVSFAGSLMPQGRTSLISFKWYSCTLYSPRRLLPAQAKTYSVTIYPSLLHPLSCQSHLSDTGWNELWAQDLEKSTRECALTDKAVPVNMRGVIVTVQQPLHRGTVMVMAAPPIRQTARKSPVSPERSTRPPGSLRVGASPIWSVALQWVQSDSWHLETWKRFLQQPPFQHYWMMNSLSYFFLRATQTLPMTDSPWNTFCYWCELGNRITTKKLAEAKATVNVMA